jgi:hypothetical protein
MSNILVPIQFNLFVVIPDLRERRRKVAAAREGNSFNSDIYVTEGKGCYCDRSYVSDILRPRREVSWKVGPGF